MTNGTVTSRDGTSIAFECAGNGPALILVDAAGHYRRLSSFDGLIGLLIRDFTVYHYDRRGRGESTDTAPYAVEREIDDLAALIAEAGCSAFVYGFSSGALLAMHAAARGLAIDKLAVLEPPIDTSEDRTAQAAFTAELTALIAADDRAGAVAHFLNAVGVPVEIIAQMHSDGSWAAMEAVAHTLVYDCLVSAATSLELLASIVCPTLVLDSRGSGEALTAMAATVAAALPNCSHRSLDGGWHGVADDALASALVEFFSPNDSHVQRALDAARTRLSRLTPRQAWDAQRQGAFVVDIRPEYQRRADGDIPGAVVIERNHLEWRLDPCSPSRIPEATAHDLQWIVMCDEGFSSSLAAAALQSIGLVNATDVVGGFQRWRADSCPIALNESPVPPRLAKK